MSFERVVPRSLRQRNVPAHHSLARAECLREAEKAVEHVLARARRNASIREQPLQLARPGPVKAELHTGADRAGDEACPEGQLHVEQDIELALA